MRSGKDEEKTVGPMFPRLHVNDTENGGPRAPPRNKMALYEQLSIPSQRFNPGVLPINPNNATNLVSPMSSSQETGHERGAFSPLQLPFSGHPAAKPRTRLSTPLVQFEQKKNLEEDDFSVPIFVHSRMGPDHTKHNNSMDPDHAKHNNSMEREKLSAFSPSYLVRPMKIQNANDKEPKITSSTGPKLRKEGRSENEENSNDFVAGREQSVRASLNLSSREITAGGVMQTNTYSICEPRDQPPNSFSRLQEANDSLQQECRSESEPSNTGCGAGITDKPVTGLENGNSSSSTLMRAFLSEKQRTSNGPINHFESCEGRAYPSLENGNVDRDDDDGSETSMVDSITRLDISPDDVVGIMGQKHFWKARKAIASQQRVFAFQVFELHRLIKVQRWIAGAPHLLLEENAYLGKPLTSSPANKLPLEYNILKEPANIAKHKDDSEKPNHKMECSAENAVGKTSLSSVQNGSHPSNYRPFFGSPPPMTDTKGPWSFHQPPGHQWLFPVMSPAEGLVYKPYPGPGFTDPVCGGCGPPGSTPIMGNFINPTYGVPPSHPHYQGIEIPPFAHTTGYCYFPPYGMPVMNPAISSSGVEQMNHFTRSDLHGQLWGVGANFNLRHQSSNNLPSQKNGTLSNGAKLNASKDDELQFSSASSPSERAQGIKIWQSTEGRNAETLFATSPAINVSDGGPQPREADQLARVIKAVPHNARSANESAARIFQSIQKERKHLDSI